MRIPADAHLPEEKIRDYLLVFQEERDKSRFLAEAGFDPSSWELLRDEIRRLSAEVEAEPGRPSPYGNKWYVEGKIKGPNGKEVSVLLVWMEPVDGGPIRFITLVPGEKSG
jgi:hypothetical protein